MLERDGLERLAPARVCEHEDGEAVLLDPCAHGVEDEAHIAGVACAEEVCDVVDDEYIDAHVDGALEDEGEQVAVGPRQVVVEVVGCEDVELGRVGLVGIVLGESRQQLVLGVFEVEIEDALAARDDFGSDAHGEDSLADMGLAEEACHLTLVPEPVPEVDGRGRGANDVVGRACDEYWHVAGVVGVALALGVGIAVLVGSDEEVVGDGVFLFRCHKNMGLEFRV